MVQIVPGGEAREESDGSAEEEKERTEMVTVSGSYSDEALEIDDTVRKPDARLRRGNSDAYFFISSDMDET